MKRADVSMSLKEMELVLNALDTVQHDPSSRLYEVLTELKEQLEEDENYATSISEDEDGYESYTEEAKEGLKERYSSDD